MYIAARQYKWLIPLMALVMVFIAPLQAFASPFQHPASVCPGMSGHAAAATLAGQAAPAVMQGQHCTHADQQAPSTAQPGTAHNDCGPSCMGSCGVCAHCPVGISSFSTSPESPVQRFVPLAQHQPSDVTPKAALRPPRLFS